MSQGYPTLRRRSVSVVIAAHNAAPSIERAVRSALAQPMAEEVILVDDCSGDATAEVSRQADDGTGRLVIHRLRRNVGPSAARNIGIFIARGEYIAILDADDFFLPGRIARLFARDDWDMIADNIAFLSGLEDVEHVPWPCAGCFYRLDLARFADGNVSRRGRPRGELGFLKPVIRRSFLDRHRLRYSEELRFGEDFDLYARALAHGARFLLTDACGYAAVERADSLSSRHAAADLARLVEVDERLMVIPGLTSEGRRAVRRHHRHVLRKHWLRFLMERRRDGGTVAAVGHALSRPGRLVNLAVDVARMKIDSAFGVQPFVRSRSPMPLTPRLLFNPRPEFELEVLGDRVD